MANITLSTSGILSDADVQINSATFGTDQTAAIQAIINGANAGDTIVFDVKASATQLAFKGNITYEFPPLMGLIQRNSSNKPFIVNQNRSSGAIVDENITIKGGGVLNFNGYTGASVQAKESLDGWTVGMRFAGVRNLRVEDMNLINARTFASFVSNFDDVQYLNVYCASNKQLNQDGCKFLTGKNLIVKNLVGLNLGDDTLSICANDIFWPVNPPPANQGSGQTAYDPYAVYGPIENVIVDGVSISDSRYAIRLLSGDQPVRNVNIQNVRGYTESVVFIIDNYAEAPKNLYGAGGENSNLNTGHFGAVRINDVNIHLKAGSYKNTFAYLHGAFEGISFENFKVPANGNPANYPVIKVDTGSTIQKLVLTNFEYPAGQTGVQNLGAISETVTNTGNAIIGKVNVIQANQAISFAAAGITAENTSIIYEDSGAGINSYVPGGGSNTVTGFSSNKVYYLIAKQNIDLSSIAA